MKPCLTTGAGSLPVTSETEAVSYVFKHYDIPFCPELPKQGLTHHLIHQFLEDFPGWSEDRLWIDLSKFEKKIPHDFQFSYLSSLPSFLATLQSSQKKELYKLQVPGPYTVATQVNCSDGQKIIFHGRVYKSLQRFLIKKTLTLLEKFPPEKECLLVIDEPMLVEQSAKNILPFLEKMKREVQSQFNDRAIWVGVHSCHQWTSFLFETLFKSSIDLLSFDYLKNRKEIPWTSLLSALQEKWILWGVVSTTGSLDSFEKDLKNLGLPQHKILSIVRRSLFSPTCGSGLLKKDQEEKMSRHLLRISEECRLLLSQKG